MLSAEDRKALEERAIGLRAEHSALTAERDMALQTASRTSDDVRLLEEVARLERDVDQVRADKERVVGTVEDAAAAMQAAMAVEGKSSPAAAAVVESVVSEADDKTEVAPVTVRTAPKEGSK